MSEDRWARATGVGVTRSTRRPFSLTALATLLLWALALTAACGGPEPLPDADVPLLLERLASHRDDEVERAALRIEEAKDRRFIAPLIELLRASQLGVAARSGYNRRVIALERLAGEPLGGDWLAWADWYARNEVELPPGFTDFKGALFAGFDPAFAGFLDGELPSRLDVAAIHWGGVPVDGIPPLDEPVWIPADAADWLEPGEPVVGLVVEGDARAYPVRILDWHELVNDRVGGLPVALSWCSLCGSAVAFDATVDGEATRFGTSGLLYQSNKLMYDGRTRTLWRQLTGEPVLGPLAVGDTRLRVLSSVVSRWSDWRDRHPDTRVLSIETGFDRVYQPGNPYGGYYQSITTRFPVLVTRDEFAAKERVFGLFDAGEARAWSLEKLVAAGVLDDEVGDLAVVITATEGRIEVEGTSEILGPVRYDAGGSVRAYARGERRFTRGPDERTLDDESGAHWQVTEEALVSETGERLERIPGTLAYWFAWQAIHPNTLVYGD